jgi:chorismate mutase / prephenate dehydratase
MARKNESDNAVATRSAASLKHLRSTIDKLDLQILKLINERAVLAADIGRLKTDHGTEVFSPAREEEVYQNILENNKGPLDPATIRAVYRELMSGARALQKVLKIAYLGPEYSFSHLAAVERFGQQVEFMGVGSITAVFEEVNRSHVDFGVVPLENSTDGGVSDTLDMFVRMPHLRIIAEVRLHIHHNLIAACEQQQIRRVYSKPQALSQCRSWLSKNVPYAQLIEVSSTAAAVKLAQQEPGAAAVASRHAAVHFNVPILFQNIEDMPNNETRFAVVGTQESAKTGHDKTAIAFRVAHNPGALVNVLEVFKQAKVNLTWIESFPSRQPKPAYLFFVDFEGHIEDPKVKRVLTTLEENCEHLAVLGSFPMATVSG